MTDPRTEPDITPYGEVDPDGPPSVETHQPGHDDETALGPRSTDGDPPDAVGGEDDRSGGPEDRAPEPPPDPPDD